MTRWRLIKPILAIGAVAIVGLSVAAGIAATRDSGDDTDSVRGQGDDSGSTAWLGVLAETSGDPEGARLVHVFDDSPGAAAGLEKDDLITAVAGEATPDEESLRAAIRGHAPGDEVTLTVIESGEGGETSVDATLGERPEHRPFDFQLPDGVDNLLPGFDRLLDGSFRYLDEDGNVVEVAALAGTIAEISDVGITIETNEGGERTFGLTDDARVPGGLEAGDEVIVVTVDGEVAVVIAPGHFPGIPLPHFDLEGDGLPFCDEDANFFAPDRRFEDLRELLCDGDFEFEPEDCEEARNAIDPLPESGAEWRSSDVCTFFGPVIQFDHSAPESFCDDFENIFQPNKRLEDFHESVCHGLLDIDFDNLCEENGWLDYLEVDEEDADYICALPLVPPGRLGALCEGGQFPHFLPGLYDEDRMREELCLDSSD